MVAAHLSMLRASFLEAKLSVSRWPLAARGLEATKSGSLASGNERWQGTYSVTLILILNGLEAGTQCWGEEENVCRRMRDAKVVGEWECRIVEVLMRCFTR